MLSHNRYYEMNLSIQCLSSYKRKFSIETVHFSFHTRSIKQHSLNYIKYKTFNPSPTKKPHDMLMEYITWKSVKRHKV